MLRIVIPALEYYDESKEEFIKGQAQTLQLEHSLVSISKWEAKWQKSFISKEPKTDEEIMHYVQCMTITQNVDLEVYNRLTKENMEQIRAYIEAPMTATTFIEDRNGKSSRERVTSELIYYWMIALNIPLECQKWHLNRLLTLIRICNIKNQPPKKMSRKEIQARNTSLNAARRRQLNTMG